MLLGVGRVTAQKSDERDNRPRPRDCDLVLLVIAREGLEGGRGVLLRRLACGVYMYVYVCAYVCAYMCTHMCMSTRP